MTVRSERLFSRKPSESSLTSWSKKYTVTSKNHKSEKGKDTEASKGAWRMPRLSETTKDVVSCEKLRGGANDL